MERCAPSPTHCERTSVTTPWKMTWARLTSSSNVGGMTVVPWRALAPIKAVRRRKGQGNFFIRGSINTQKLGQKIARSVHSSRIEIVNFHQSNACCVVYSANDRRVIPRTQRGQDGGLERIRWRQPAGNNGGILGAVHPIIVAREQGTGPIVKFQNRIGQHASQRI